MLQTQLLLLLLSDCGASTPQCDGLLLEYAAAWGGRYHMHITCICVLTACMSNYGTSAKSFNNIAEVIIHSLDMHIWQYSILLQVYLKCAHSYLTAAECVYGFRLAFIL